MLLPAADRLALNSGRELLAVLDGRRSVDGIVRRQAFRPEDLVPWLGSIAILQWSAEHRDYVYRLFGTHLAGNIGRDLTGRTLAEWPPLVARIMRGQADRAIKDGALVVSHYRLRVFQRDGRVEDRVRTQEKLMVPIAYGDGAADAVLVYVDQGPDDIAILRRHMDATDGSCWCTSLDPVCVGCPFPAVAEQADQPTARSLT